MEAITRLFNLKRPVWLLRQWRSDVQWMLLQSLNTGIVGQLQLYILHRIHWWGKLKNNDFLDHLGKEKKRLANSFIAVYCPGLGHLWSRRKQFHSNVSTLPVHERGYSNSRRYLSMKPYDWCFTINSEISPMILTDVTETFGPLEVKNSQDRTPYASRTRIG